VLSFSPRVPRENSAFLGQCTFPSWRK